MQEITNHIQCTKVKFADEEFAMKYVRKLNATSTRKRKPVRAYLCEKCNCWHLTSKTEKEELEMQKLRDEIERLTNKLTDRDNRIKNLENQVAKHQTRIYELTNKR